MNRCMGCNVRLSTFSERRVFGICDQCMNNRCVTCGDQMYTWYAAGKSNCCVVCQEPVCGNCEQSKGKFGLKEETVEDLFGDDEYSCERCVDDYKRKNDTRKTQK